MKLSDLYANDPPATYVQRPPVPSTAKMWGDREAEAAGLYDTPTVMKAAQAARLPQGFQLINDAPSGDLPQGFELIPDGPSATVADRSAIGAEPQNAAALRAGLENKAREMTTGPKQDHFAGMVTDFLNQGSAAGQGTTPNIGAQTKNLISTETAESDAGELLYKDPATGQMVPTDQNKHVALRDPADGKIKVYARTEDTDEGRLSSAGRILMTGLATGAPTARPAIPTPSVVQQTPRASDIFSTAKPHYREFSRVAGQVEATPEAAKGLADQLRGALEGVNLTPEMAGPAVNSAIRMLESGSVKTLDDLQKIKRMTGRGFNAPEKDARDAAAAISSEIGRIIEQASPEASRALKTGDQIHSAARGVQELQRKSDIADLRTGRAGYGGNAVNAMRQVLSPIVQKHIEGKTSGFKPHEIAAMREIVEGTTATNRLRELGQLSPTKGSIATIGGMGTAGTAGVVAAGPAGAALAAVPPIVGIVSNKLATVLTGKQIDRLRELVAKRSPEYAKAVERAVKRYDEAQMKFVADPSPNRFAGYLSASRALSSGLTRDGIQITSGDLLKNLQLGGATRAEDEQ